MSGEIAEPKLYQEYSGYSSTVRDELIRLDEFSQEYGITPSSYSLSAITYPDRRRKSSTPRSTTRTMKPLCQK